MKPIHITICHSDPVYARALAQGLASRWRQATFLVATPGAGDLPSTVDWILSDDPEDVPCPGAKIIQLYDDPEDLKDEQQGIHRYQPLCLIAAHLRDLCMEKNAGKAPASSAGNTIFWGFTSGVGGSGTSSLAQAAGRILARLYRANVLLISFDGFTVCDSTPGTDERTSLRELLYRIACGESVTTDLLQIHCRRDPYGLYRLSGTDRINPLCRTDPEELYRLMRQIAQSGAYQRVLLDVPPAIFFWKELMRMCEKKIVNFGFHDHRSAPSCLQQEVLRECCLEDGTEPDTGIYVFCSMEDPATFLPEHWSDGVDIHGQFGSEVRALVDRMEH